MKKFILIILIVLVLSSCDMTETVDVGQWVEVDQDERGGRLSPREVYYIYSQSGISGY